MHMQPTTKQFWDQVENKAHNRKNLIGIISSISDKLEQSNLSKNTSFHNLISFHVAIISYNMVFNCRLHVFRHSFYNSLFEYSHLLKANPRQKWTNQAISSFHMPRKSNDFIPEWCVKLEKTWTIIIVNFVCDSIVHIWLIIHIRKTIHTWKYPFVSFDPLLSTGIMHMLSYGFTYRFIHWISSHLFIFV